MSLSAEQREDFAAYVQNPDTWLFACHRNLAVARLLMKVADEQLLKPKSDFFERVGCFYSSYFHAALALENAAKAVYVSNGEIVVSGEKLKFPESFGRSGHALMRPLVALLGDLTEFEQSLVTKLEEFGWAGRYSVPMNAKALYDQKKMQIMRTSSSDELPIVESLVDRLVAPLARPGSVA